VANYLCRLNFRSPLGSANYFNKLSSRDALAFLPR